MTEPDLLDQELEAPPPPKRHGCLLFGLATVVVLIVAGAIAIQFVIPRILEQAMQGLVREYSETAPKAIPVTTLPAADYEALRARLREFADAVDAGDRPAELALTADECNALIEQSPECGMLRRQVFVSLAANRVRLDFSVPLDDVDDGEKTMPRWLNGHAVLAFELVDGSLQVRFLELEVGGKHPFVEGEAPLEWPLPVQQPELGALDASQGRIEHFAVQDDRLVIRVGAAK